MQLTGSDHLMMATDDGKSRVPDDPCQSAADGDQQAQISHNSLTNLVRRHRTRASMLDNRWPWLANTDSSALAGHFHWSTDQKVGGSSPSERAQLNGHLAPRQRYRCSGCVPSSSAYQWPSRGHRVKDAYGVACDRFATCDPPTAHQGFAPWGRWARNRNGDL